MHDLIVIDSKIYVDISSPSFSVMSDVAYYPPKLQPHIRQIMAWMIEADMHTRLDLRTFQTLFLKIAGACATMMRSKKNTKDLILSAATVMLDFQARAKCNVEALSCMLDQVEMAKCVTEIVTVCHAVNNVLPMSKSVEEKVLAAFTTESDFEPVRTVLTDNRRLNLFKAKEFFSTAYGKNFMETLDAIKNHGMSYTQLSLI